MEISDLALYQIKPVVLIHVIHQRNDHRSKHDTDNVKQPTSL